MNTVDFKLALPSDCLTLVESLNLVVLVMS